MNKEELKKVSGGATLMADGSLLYINKEEAAKLRRGRYSVTFYADYLRMHPEFGYGPPLEADENLCWVTELDPSPETEGRYNRRIIGDELIAYAESLEITVDRPVTIVIRYY